MKIGIIGTGLIGGSLAYALKKTNKYKIYCYNRNLEISEKAKKAHCVDEYFLSPEALVDKSDIVVLATTLSSYKEIIFQIKNYLENKVLTDIGSVKEKPSEEIFEILKNKENFVPAHPIAGKETSGFDYASSDLFQNKKTIITPFSFTNQKNINEVSKIWTDAGAKIEILKPETHDKIYSSVSHFVQLLSFATKKYISVNDFTFEFCRLQNSPEKMWNEIFFYNQKNLLNTFGKFQEKIEDLINQKLNFTDEKSTIDSNDFAAYLLSNIIYDITPKEYLNYTGTGFEGFTKITNEFSNSKANSKVIEDSFNIIKAVTNEIKNSYLSRNV